MICLVFVARAGSLWHQRDGVTTSVSTALDLWSGESCLQLPGHQVGGEVDGEGGLGGHVRGVVGGGHGQVAPSRQSYGRGVRVVGVNHRVDVTTT